jgi:hypothetical protein
MSFAEDELLELVALSSEVAVAMDGGQEFVLLSAVKLPDGCIPAAVDLLVAPNGRDGYPSRVYFSQQVTSRVPRNWHVQNTRIAERNWFAFSWRVNQGGLRLLQLVMAHLEALR